jgi:RNA polymerase sigma-70 factor, ECF subfamily
MDTVNHEADGRRLPEEAGAGPPAGDGEGSPMAMDELFSALYEDLRRMARRHLRGERADHTLSTTALVHESYLKLGRLDRMQWQSRSHFAAEASRAMRRILVDHAVRRGAGKRGGARERVELREDMAATVSVDDEILAVHGALEALARTRPRPARVVECRVFGGMTVPEIAEALELSPATVKRDWEIARAWLNRELADGADPPGG